jgi:hypothetical protein
MHLESNQIKDVMMTVRDWNSVDDEGAREERAGMLRGRRRVSTAARHVMGAEEEAESTEADYKTRDWAAATRKRIRPCGHSCRIHSRRIWSK